MRAANAAEWPERLVRLVVPFPPAGAIDVVARLVAPKLQQAWGKDVVIENRPGAGGNIGNEMVARAAPDGYTLLLTQSGIVVNQFLYPKLNYDPVADLAPVSLLALVPNVMVVPASSPAKTVEEFIAYAKTKTLSYGSAGNGTSSHMCGEMFKQQVGVEMTHVPYRGSAPALNDLIPGRLDVMIDSVSGLVPHIQSGSLRALGVTATRRLPVLPELRPLAETALPGFDAAGLVAALAPAKTPPEIVAKIQKGFNGAVGAGDVEAAGEPRRRGGGLAAAGSGAIHQVRDGQVGAADQRREDQAGWLSSSSKPAAVIPGRAKGANPNP